MATSTRSKQFPLLSALLILVCCFGLFWLDHETRTIADLFRPGNLVALMLYFVPTYLICYALFVLFEKRKPGHGTALALSIGIPAGFILVIITLSFLMGRL